MVFFAESIIYFKEPSIKLNSHNYLDKSESILAALAYYDLFHYPLTQIELYQFLQKTSDYQSFSLELERLVSEQQVYRLDEFYSLHDDPALANRRRKGNEKAKLLLSISEKVSSFLFKFPYVRGIGVSGSLSKNYADENSDIDLFIITKKNRLWIARTLLHIFKKLTFFVGKQHYFCMNYFVDEAGLSIEEKNIYTATEIVTLLPIKGFEAFREFNKQNSWVKLYLPNHSMKISYASDTNSTLLKRFLEVIFENWIGALIDKLLMRITRKRWRKKTRNGKLNSRGIIMSMKVGSHYAKPHPDNFQIKLITEYEDKLALMFLAAKPALSE
jgi:predicted nucleotidyltransferase